MAVPCMKSSSTHVFGAGGRIKGCRHIESPSTSRSRRRRPSPPRSTGRAGVAPVATRRQRWTRSPATLRGTRGGRAGLCQLAVHIDLRRCRTVARRAHGYVCSPLECRRLFPQVTAKVERAPLTPAAALRLGGLVTAAWATFDEVAADSLAELRGRSDDEGCSDSETPRFGTHVA